jgi:hypothetical protein
LNSGPLPSLWVWSSSCIWSAFWIIVRSLSIWNRTPSVPMRSER